MYKSKRLLCVISALLLLLGCTPAESSAPSVAQQTSSVPLYGYPVPTSEITNPEFYATGVDLQFADLGENRWEIKRMSLDYGSIYFEDMVGILEFIPGNGHFILKDYVFAENAAFSQDDLYNLYKDSNEIRDTHIPIRETYESRLASLISHGMLPWAATGSRGGIIEYHGYFYYFDGQRVHYTDPTTDCYLYALSCEAALTTELHEPFTYMRSSLFFKQAQHVYRLVHRSMPIGDTQSTPDGLNIQPWYDLGDGPLTPCE